MGNQAAEKKRVTKLRELLNLSQTEFSRKIGVSQGALSQIENGHSRLSMETLISLVKAFNVNCNWLVNGNGDIFINEEPDSEESHSKGIQLVDADASAGYVSGYNQPDFLGTLDSYMIPGFKNEQNLRLFEIEGDSMVPTLFPSDLVIAKKNKLPQIKSNTLVVLLTKQKLMAKRLKKSDKNTVRLLSDNPNHADKSYSIDDIVEVWQIQGKITKHLLENYVFEFQRMTSIQKDIKDLKYKLSTIVNDPEKH